MNAADVDPTLLRHYDAEGGRHAHDHAQVLFGWDGSLQLEVGGRAAHVDVSCGLVVPAGALHAYEAPKPARVLVLDCDAGPATDRLRRFALPADWRRGPVDRGVLFAALGTAPALKPRRPIDLDALAALVDADLARPWSVAEIAAACHLSPQRLRARFAAIAGMSPLAFVRARRLDRAEALLRHGWSLEAAALHVGYGAASALCAALRRERDTGARALRDPRRALRAT